MKYPIHDEYATNPGYLCWFREVQNPVRIGSVSQGVSQEDLLDADMVSEFHCQVFDLADAKDMRKYQTVYQRILDGWYSLVSIQRQWNEEENTMKVWMEWTQDYLEVPDDIQIRRQ